MASPEATAKVNETNLNLVTAAWPEDTRFVVRKNVPPAHTVRQNKSKMPYATATSGAYRALIGWCESSFTRNRIERKTQPLH